MPEIGLLPFARVALDCAAAILPRYRSRFSKHQFTQPQLLAVLCLMRSEDWTFRETEVRLREHGELRAVLQLTAVPDYTTLYRFLRRLDDSSIDRVLGESVRRFKAQRRSRGHRWHRAVAQRHQQLLYSPHRAAFARHDALEPLVEVPHRRRSRRSTHSGAARAPGPLVRLPRAAEPGRRGGSGDAHRLAAGRRRIRHRSQPPAHSSATGSAQHHPRETRTQQPRGNSRTDAPALSATHLRSARQGRDDLLGHQAQTLGASARAQPAHASPPSAASRTDFQLLPLEASLHFSRMSTEPSEISFPLPSVFPHLVRLCSPLHRAIPVLAMSATESVNSNHLGTASLPQRRPSIAASYRTEKISSKSCKSASRRPIKVSRLETTPILCFVQLTLVSIRTVVPIRANENRTPFRASKPSSKGGSSALPPFGRSQTCAT